MKSSAAKILILTLVYLLTGCQSPPSSENTNLSAQQIEDILCLQAYSALSQIKNVQYLIKTAERGNTTCKLYLGHSYERGIGVEQDIYHAKALYLEAAQNEGIAYFYLGRMAEDGIGGPVNFEAARDYYLASFNTTKNHESSIRLAQLLESGKGGAIDLPGAVEFYLKALGRDDRALEGIHRLQARGIQLNDSQKSLYEDIWIGQVENSLFNRLAAQRQFLLGPDPRALNPQLAKIQIRYTEGTLIAIIKILQSSGNEAFDSRLNKVLSGYSFDYEPLLEPPAKALNVIYEVDPYAL